MDLTQFRNVIGIQIFPSIYERLLAARCFLAMGRVMHAIDPTKSEAFIDEAKLQAIVAGQMMKILKKKGSEVPFLLTQEPVLLHCFTDGGDQYLRSLLGLPELT
jgi:hypothetical protein